MLRDRHTSRRRHHRNRTNLHVSAPQRTNSVTAKPSNEITEFQNHVLASAGLWRPPLLIALIIRGKQNDRKTDITVGFNFLDDRAALARLFVRIIGVKPSFSMKRATSAFASPSSPWTMKILGEAEVLEARVRFAVSQRSSVRSPFRGHVPRARTCWEIEFQGARNSPVQRHRPHGLLSSRSR